MTCDRSSSCAFGTISEVEHLGMHKQEAEAKCRKATALATETALDFRCFRILPSVDSGGYPGEGPVVDRCAKWRAKPQPCVCGWGGRWEGDACTGTVCIFELGRLVTIVAL